MNHSIPVKNITMRSSITFHLYIISGMFLHTALWLNSLSPVRCAGKFESVIFDHMSRIKFMSISKEIVLRWTPQNLTNEKSTLAQVMD